MEIAELIQGLGKIELNAPKLKKFTKEDWKKIVELFDVYFQSNVLDRMVELIAPSSLSFTALLCRLSKDQLLVTPSRL